MSSRLAETEKAEADAAVVAAAAEKVASAIEGLREDTKDEGGLGDAARETGNIRVSNAAWELRTLVKEDPELLRLVIDGGGISALVRALRQRPNSEAVQSKCSTALGYIAAGDNQTMVAEAGGIEVVISALRGHPNSVAVLEHAVEALGQLVAHDHHQNQMLVGLAGGIDAVTIALHQHPENEALQKNAVTTLGLLVRDNIDNQLHAGRARGIQAIVSCLKSHLRSETITKKAAEALRLLVFDSHENKELAREVGTIATLLAVLRRHRKNECIQVLCFQALTEIVTDNLDNQEMAGEAGGIRAIVSALNAHPGSDSVQERACETLGHLVAKNQVNQNLSREAGLIEVVIHTALEQHPASIPVQIKACATLTSLVAHNAESQRLAGAAGGVEVVTAGLKRHLDCETVIEVVSRALSSLILNNRENQTLARAAGAIEAVILVLRQHPTNPVVQTRALQLLRNLAVGNHENTRVAVNAGGIDEVVSALRQPPETAERSCSRGGSRGGKRPEKGTDPETDRPVSASRSRKHHHTYQKLAREAGVIEACVAALKPPAKGDKTKVILNKINALPFAKLLSALTGLVAGSFENQRLATESGAVETVLDVMKSDHYSDVIQEHASKALTGLFIDNAANQRSAKVAKADDALTEAQATHAENPPVSEALRQALEALRAGETFSKRIMETDYFQRHSVAVPIQDTAMRGVTLEQLLELQDFIQKTLKKHDLEGSRGPTFPLDTAKRRSVTWEDLTMYQIADHFILPLTRESRCSFVEQVSQAKQPPMWMISHWWGTPFPYTVRMLQLQSRSRHLHATSSVSYWCCAFANNQHERSELDESDVLRSPFARAMLSQSCMGTVLLCDTEVTPLLRTWCVFEAHVTQMLRSGELADRTDKKRYFLDILAPVVEKDTVVPEDSSRDKVTITMLQDAVGGSWNEVSDTEGVFFPLGIAHLGVGVDVRNADTTLESDKAIILNFLTQGRASKEPPPSVHPKYDELNNFIHTVFASAELYRVASEQPEECVEAATELIQMRADVNSFVRQGNTPLFAAAGADPASAGPTDANRQFDLVNCLLSARADVNRANASLKTVIECSDSLGEASRSLLIQHGAKSFSDAAPDLERSANVQLALILATGFQSEAQAFIGGDAGTKLTPAAHHSLQVAATSSLKLYHWAPCRMCIQTSAKRHQGQLADQRAKSVMLALESAGCKNSFEIHFGSQRVLLSLSLSIALATATAPLLPKMAAGPAPPSVSKIGRWERDLADAPGSDDVIPRAVLAFRATPDRLPPVTMVGRLPPVALANEAFVSVPTHVGNGITTAYRPTEVHRPSPINVIQQARPSPINVMQQSIGYDDPLECSMHSNDSLMSPNNEEMTGNGPWPTIIPITQGSFESLVDTGRPATRQDKRRPEIANSRCEAWGSTTFGRMGTTSGAGGGQQSSNGRLGSPQVTSGLGGRASAGGRKLHQTASSSGGFGTSSTMTGADWSPVATGSRSPPQMSIAGSSPQTPSGGSTPLGAHPSADLDVLAVADRSDRWFQTSISVSLSQPNLRPTCNRPDKGQLGMKRQDKNGSAPTAGSMFIDQFGESVPPTASGGRPARRGAPVDSATTDDWRPPTRCGPRPLRDGSRGGTTTTSNAGLGSGLGGPLVGHDGDVAADARRRPRGGGEVFERPMVTDMMDFPVTICRGNSLPALSGVAPTRASRTDYRPRVSDLFS